MAQVDSSKAKRSYKKRQRKTEGRKGRDGSESVIQLDVLRERIQDLVGLRVALGQATRKFQEAIKATAEASGLVSATVMRFVKARAGDNFREERMKAQQMALVFDEIGELGADEKPEGTAHPETLFGGNGNGASGHGRDPDDADDDDGEQHEAAPTPPANGRGRRRGANVGGC